MIDRHRLLAGIALLGSALVAGCAAPCEGSLGVYPPPHILVTGAEEVEVPHISWTCDDFHSDSMDPPPSVATDEGSQVAVEATLESGTSVEARFGNQGVAVSPNPREGANTWMFTVPEPSQPLILRICSSDQRCAVYWTNIYSG